MNETQKTKCFNFCPYITPMIFLLISIPVCLPFILSTWIVSHFVYQPMLVNAKNEDKEWRKSLYLEEMNKDYSKKFPLIKDLSDNTPPEYNLLCDTTPNGFVFFRYIKDEEGFEYWCDKSIDYKNLETLARKYVNLFNCKQIYCDRKKLLEEKLNKIYEQKNNSNTINNTDVSHNTDISHKTEIPNTESVFADLKASKKTEKKIEYVCDTANKYIKRGTLKDYNNIATQPIKKNTENTQNDKFFSWASWKLHND